MNFTARFAGDAENAETEIKIISFYLCASAVIIFFIA